MDMAPANRIDRLERQVRTQQRLLGAGAIVAVGVAVAAFTTDVGVGSRDLIETHAIRIVDAAGKPRILIGAPAPADGRKRKDAQTASIVVLGPEGQDRLIIGESPGPRIAGKTYPRVGTAYGVVLHDKTGSERGGMAFLDNGRAVIALDRPTGDAVAMTVNDKTGFAGITVNYANPLGKYAEAWRMGTRGDEGFVSMQDRAQAERARLSTAGAAAPALQLRPAGAAPAP